MLILSKGHACAMLAGLVGLILAESGPIILTVSVSLIYTMRLDWGWTGLASPVQSSADHGEPEKDMQSLSFMGGVSAHVLQGWLVAKA